MRPTLGEEPAAEAANLVGYPSGDTVIGLATDSYMLCATRCLQAVRLFTVNFLIFPATGPVELCPAGSRRIGRDKPFDNLSRAGTMEGGRVLPA